MDAVTLAAALAAAAKHTQPWSVVSSRPVRGGGGLTASGAANQQTTRLAEVAPYDLVAVRLVYANWLNGVGGLEGPNYSGYRVKAAVHKAGTAAPDRAATDPLFPVTFHDGREFGYNQPGGMLISDPVPVGIKKGERWWHESYGDVLLPAGPAAPTLTANATGGSYGTTTVYVAVTYVFADGTESLPSAEASLVFASGTTNSVTVTAPTSPGGTAVGWRCYYTNGSTANALKYENPAFPVQPLGTNLTFGGSFTNSSLHRMVRSPTHPGLPLDRGLLIGQGQVTIGENNVNGRDWTTATQAWVGSGSYGGTFSPITVLGVAADGKLHRSVALLGDSIQSGTGDSGYGGALGGFGFRACANQTAQLGYDPTKTPLVGFAQVAQGGETLGQFLPVTGGARRRGVAELATTILDNYGTNDLGAGSAPIWALLLTQIGYYAGRKRYFHTTFMPKSNSTDGWQTTANQTVPSTDFEADRRALNNLFRSNSPAGPVTGETLYRSPVSGTAASGAVLTGGDGTAVKFYTAYPFQTGTEAVQVNGSTKAVTTDYTYRQTAVIGGVTYASGVQFTAAPANTATVTASYTRPAGLRTVTGYAGTFDTAAPLETNAAGVVTLNGGCWKPALMTGGITGTPTGFAAAQLTDSTKTWTVDQWRGWCVYITADPTTPAAVGQQIAVQSNTASTLNLAAGWTTTPSTSATYLLYQPYVIDGVHPTSTGHLVASQQIDATKF